MMSQVRSLVVSALLCAVAAPALASPAADEIIASPLVAPTSVAQVNTRCDLHSTEVAAAQARFEAMPLASESSAIFRAYDDLYNLAILLPYTDLNVVKDTHPDPDIRAAAEACVTRGSALIDNIAMSKPIFERLQKVGAGDLPAELRYTIDRQIDNYRRSGVDRDDATRNRIAELFKAITATTLDFDRNLREDVKTVMLRADDLKGLPEDYLAAHPAGPDGMIAIKTTSPDVQPILQYAQSDAVRRKVSTAWYQRAKANDALLKTLIAQRAELAGLLGYPDYASYDLANRMARDPQRARRFLDEISAAARPVAEREAELMLARLQRDDPSIERLGLWNSSYATRLTKIERFDVDPEVIREYFHFDKVQAGIFKLTEDLFGVEIRPWQTAVWAPDVEAFEMVEAGEVIGRFYLDMHPRDGKYTHARMSPIRIGIEDRIVPEAALITNFPDGLMEHGQVETYLHEFGHLLHWIFAGQREWATQNFGEVENDVTEAPSTLLEQWVWDYDTLAKFATNAMDEPIPAALVQKMNAGKSFGEAFATMIQLGLASSSLGFYSQDLPSRDLTQNHLAMFGRYALADYPEGAHPQTSWTHLTGYGASYYTYQWSEALAADLLSRFRSAGLRDQATARAYRQHILAPGGSDSMNVLARNFLGRDWSVDSYRKELEGGAPAAAGAGASRR